MKKGIIGWPLDFLVTKSRIFYFYVARMCYTLMAFFIKGIAIMTPLKTEIVRARVSHELKQSAEQVFDDLGMSMTEAIRLFLTQVSLRQEFPIELKIPNKVTLEAIKESVTEKTYDSVDDLFNEVLGDAQY